nr:MAG TPA: hypothetical protein [Caudoviricetes sp.]
MTLEINSCKNYEILEVRQGDKGSRIIDFAFTVNGETVDLASTMSAKVNATVDNVIVADSVAAVVDTENNVVTVTLTDTMLALSGICKMDIVLTEGNEIITAETVCLRVGKSVINDDSKAFPGASSIAEITKEVENARGGQNSLGARLDKTDKSIARKLDSMPFDSEPKNNSPCYLTSGTVYKALQTKADKTETDNLLAEKADKVDVDVLLANKANLVNSSNIFDFDAWAKGLQSLTIPVYRGTLDELNFAEKSITITPTPTSNDTFTMGWYAPFPETMKISVKPNTKYWICWLTNNNNSNAFVFLNGNSTNNVRITRGKGTFVTNNDTSFITLRFGTYHNSAFKVSEIMITEKESIYLPNKVAEGVPEVANEVLAFEKTTQASLDSKYDSSNIELGTATLTPYSTQIDKIKSATCLYEKIGDIVIVNVTVIMNATSLGGTSTIALLNMPFSNKSDVIVHDIGISKNGGMFRGSVNKSAWLQFTPLNKQAYNFVADEQVNFSLIYKI